MTMEANGSKIFSSFHLWYPHQYSTLIREIEKRCGVDIRIVFSGELSSWRETEIFTDRKSVTVYLPDLSQTFSQSLSFLEKQTLILLGSLFLGKELGNAYHLISREKLLPRNRKEFATAFSLQSAELAGLDVFESSAALRLTKLFPFPDMVHDLFRAYREQQVKKSAFRFVIEKEPISNAQMYQIINHTHRFASFVGFLQEMEKGKQQQALLLRNALEGRYQPVFQLSKITVASPGVFALVLKKTFEHLKRSLSALRKTLVAIPFLDMYVTRERARLESDTADFKARKVEAEVRLQIAELTKQQLAEIQKKLALPGAFEKLETAEARKVVEKLAESSEVLHASRTKMID